MHVQITSSAGSAAPPTDWLTDFAKSRNVYLSHLIDDEMRVSIEICAHNQMVWAEDLRQNVKYPSNELKTIERKSIPAAAATKRATYEACFKKNVYKYLYMDARARTPVARRQVGSVFGVQCSIDGCYSCM